MKSVQNAAGQAGDAQGYRVFLRAPMTAVKKRRNPVQSLYKRLLMVLIKYFNYT